MPNDKEKDELLTTPLEDAQRTTPYKTPPASGETPPDLPDGSLRGLRQRYDILAEAGRGGMGIVYRVRDRETGAVVALKVLRPEIAADTAVIERFKSELLLARKITHKNVCRIYDLHRLGETAAIAMEYVEGESLRHILTRYSPISVRKGLEWTTQICDALREAHAQGVVHRDLKPENIVIDRDGNVKVMDFGIARSIETTTATTGTIVGTPAYMSPEQAQGKCADPRSDIYSLGLILYEMFTGHAGFQADTPVAFALKQIHETPPAPRELEPALPDYIEKAILKCLEKSPGKRFPSVNELAAALAGRPEAKPATAESEQGELGLPHHLLCWQRPDIALFVLALASCGYFWLAFRGLVYWFGYDVPTALLHGQPTATLLFLLGVLLFAARGLHRYRGSRANAVVAFAAGVATARLFQTSSFLHSKIPGDGESSYWLWLGGLISLTIVASYAFLCSLSYYTNRASPERIVSFSSFNRGFSHWRPSGVAILRGLAIGMALAGIFALSISAATFRGPSQYFSAVPPWPGDILGSVPNLTSQTSDWSTLNLVGSERNPVGVPFVFLQSLCGACVMVGFPLALLQRAVQSKRILILLTVAMWAASHYALWGMMLDPPAVFYIVAALQGGLLCLVYLRYDLLTLFCAVFAAESWLTLYVPGGRSPGGWGGPGARASLNLLPLLCLLALGLAAAFQRHIIAACRRVKAVLE